MPSTETSRLAGKVAIVTGGGSGFGAAIASLFASQGCKVIVADLNLPGAEKVASENPNNMQAVKMDVASKPDWESVLSRVLGQWGHVDIIVNNAGTSHRNKPTLEVNEDEFDRVFNVNVKSIYHAVAVVVPHLIKQKTGASIINIASVGATRPRPGLVWYNASKGAVSNATKGLAAEFGPHQIRVNNICPLLSGTGLFETFSGVPDTPENRAKFISIVPLGRLADALDVANAALYFASDESSFITGVSMEVDGGRCI